MERIRPTLPADIDMRLVWDGTMFMREALKEITKTLGETILIVALVVFLFMGSVRTALVPLVAMPVSLIGAAIVMLAFGFSLNLLTILAIVLSVGLVVDDAIVVVENVERHVRQGKSRIEAALIGARELRRPDHRDDHHARDGVHADRLPGRPDRFAVPGVRDHARRRGRRVGRRRAHALAGDELALRARARQGGPADGVGQPRLRVRQARIRMDARCGARNALGDRRGGAAGHGRGLAAIHVLAPGARTRRGPEPHQSVLRGRARLDAGCDQPRVARGRARDRRVSRDRLHVVADRGVGRLRRLVAKDWTQRERSTEEMYGEVYGAVSQVPGLRVFPRLDPPLPTPGQYDVELVLQSDAPPEQMLETAAAVLGAGWQSGKFLYVDTDLKIDLPEARVVLDRERIADLGLDLAGVGQELGTLLGGDYVNRFNFFDRSYKVIPQIGEEDRATLGPLLDLKIKTPDGQLVPVSTFTHVETSTAPRTLNRFQQRNAVRIFGGVNPGVTKEEGLRVLETAAAAAGGPNVVLDHAGESRQIRHEGSALTVTLGFAVVLIYLVLAAQFQSFRDPLIVLLGSVPLAISGALLFSFLDLTTINIYSQVGLITLVGLIAKNGILIVEFANTLQSRGLSKVAALREASLTRLRPVLMTSAATVFGHLPLVLVSGPGAAARNSIGTVLVAGMTVGTLFTLFVVPVFYSLIAAQRQPSPTSEATEHKTRPHMPAEAAVRVV